MELETGEEMQEVGLRPQTLDDYIGQQTVTDNLKVFIEAAACVKAEITLWLSASVRGFSLCAQVVVVSRANNNKKMVFFFISY